MEEQSQVTIACRSSTAGFSQALSGAVDEVAQSFGELNGAPAVGFLVDMTLAILPCIPNATVQGLSAHRLLNGQQQV